MYRKITATIFTVFLSFCFFIPFSQAQERRLPLAAKSKYFSIYADPSVDINALLPRLNFDYFIHMESVLGGSRDRNGILTKTIDAIYLEVSDILDIHMYSFQGNITILPNKYALHELFRKIFGRDVDERALYINEHNTIYISAEDITVGMLGHEMAHAIQCGFFVVPPPAKVQEVLSGYVEYTLRKSMGTLP